MNEPLTFFAEVVATGLILGLDASCAPEQVASVLGEHAVNRRPDIMWHDYGAIEFFWERPSSTGPWLGTHVSLQVHRLSDDPSQMNAAVRRAFGDFPDALSFDELRSAVAESGSDLVELPRREADGVLAYVNPGQAVTILVADTGAQGIREGTVWSIICGNRARGTGYAVGSAS